MYSPHKIENKNLKKDCICSLPKHINPFVTTVSNPSNLYTGVDGTKSSNTNPALLPKKNGGQVCLWVRDREGATITPEEIRDFCKGQIAHYKIPRYIEIVDEFPMTVTGKIRKVDIREIMSKKLGLAVSETA